MRRAFKTAPRRDQVKLWTRGECNELDSTVATLKVVVGDKRDLAGKSMWHLQAFAHTEICIAWFSRLDDRFDSYSDLVDLSSHQYEMHLSERGQK